MNYGAMDLLISGTISVGLAFLIVSRLVNTELGHVANISGIRQYVLMIAIGAGVLTFTFKLLLILGFTNIDTSGETETPFLSMKQEKTVLQAEAKYRWVSLSEPAEYDKNLSSGVTSKYKWEALPESVSHTNSSELIDLGKKLFNDPILSYDQTVSCASCHDLYKFAGADGQRVAIGIEEKNGNRNTPTVWNAAFQSRFFWDGRAQSLEEQAKGPIINPVEMGMPSYADVENRLNANESYRSLFSRAFGDNKPISINRIAKAIAAYEMTLVTSDTPYDRFVRGELNAMTDQQIRGMSLFQSVGCTLCHYGPNFSSASIFDDSKPYRIFPANPTPFETEFEILEKTIDQNNASRKAWRVPSLRNVALTGPWLHNGSVDKLEDVVNIMAAAQLGLSGHYIQWSDQKNSIETINRPVLSEQQISDIVAFLNALSSDKLANK